MRTKGSWNQLERYHTWHMMIIHKWLPFREWSLRCAADLPTHCTWGKHLLAPAALNWAAWSLWRTVEFWGQLIEMRQQHRWILPSWGMYREFDSRSFRPTSTYASNYFVAQVIVGRMATPAIATAKATTSASVSSAKCVLVIFCWSNLVIMHRKFATKSNVVYTWKFSVKSSSLSVIILSASSTSWLATLTFLKSLIEQQHPILQQASRRNPSF